MFTIGQKPAAVARIIRNVKWSRVWIFRYTDLHDRCLSPGIRRQTYALDGRRNSAHSMVARVAWSHWRQPRSCVAGRSARNSDLQPAQSPEGAIRRPLKSPAPQPNPHTQLSETPSLEKEEAQ